MKRFLLALLVFLLVSAACTAGLTLLAPSMLPGRGQLPTVRHARQVDLEQDAEGAWVVKDSSLLAERQAPTAPASGVRVIVEEYSTGSNDPGELGSQRMRTWSVEDGFDPQGSLRAVERGRMRLNLPPESVAALILYVESRIIPESPLWALRPEGEDRSGVSRDWSGDPTAVRPSWSHQAEKKSAWPLIAGVSLGIAAALWVGCRRSPAR